MVENQTHVEAWQTFYETLYKSQLPIHVLVLTDANLRKNAKIT
jgi:hypothetical protein